MTDLVAAVVAVSTAIRGWVVPTNAKPPKKRKRTPQRGARSGYGGRVIIVDLETTIDTSQRILYGFFRLYEHDRLVREGIITADLLDYESIITISRNTSPSHGWKSSAASASSKRSSIRKCTFWGRFAPATTYLLIW